MPLNVKGRKLDSLLMELVNAWHLGDTNVIFHLSAQAWILSRSCCIRTWAASVSEESRMVLNIVQTSANIPTSDLMTEGRLLMKQLKMVGPKTLTLRNSCSDVLELR